MNRVAQIKFPDYLPISENWLYNHIKNFKSTYSIIFAKNRVNPEMFQIKNGEMQIYSKKNIFSRILFQTGELIYKIMDFNPYFINDLKSKNLNLIHAHFGTNGYYSLKIKDKSNIPLITTFYGMDLSILPTQNPIWKDRYMKLFDKGDLFLVEGKFMASTIKKLGCPIDKIKIHRLGVRLDKLKSKPRELHENEILKILIAGRFVEKKGIPFALEGIGIFSNENPNLKIQINIIGTPSENQREINEKKKIENAIVKYNLKNNTNFLGLVSHDEFIRILYENHIFLSPSIQSEFGDNEGGVPVSIIEASASGMPIISTFHCDIPSVVINNKTGYLSKERDRYEIASNLEKCVNNRSNWEEIAKFSRKHIHSNFNVEKQSKELENIYDIYI